MLMETVEFIESNTQDLYTWTIRDDFPSPSCESVIVDFPGDSFKDLLCNRGFSSLITSVILLAEVRMVQASS